jgi:hypothetical protein
VPHCAGKSGFADDSFAERYRDRAYSTGCLNCQYQGLMFHIRLSIWPRTSTFPPLKARYCVKNADF